MRSVLAVVRGCLVLVLLAGMLVINPQLVTADDGDLWSWGLSLTGQLGNGTNTDSRLPTAVNSIPGEIAAIAVGGHHTLALTDVGTVFAWGSNSQGTLGNNSTTDSNIPIQVSGLLGIIAIAAGYQFNVALDGAGNVWTWGDNQFGQIGDGTSIDALIPVQVNGLSKIVAIYAADFHGFAVDEDGVVYGWGLNDYGQAGHGELSFAVDPAPITAFPSGTRITHLTGGTDHSLALSDDGVVYAWGRNHAGQLGDGTTANSQSPKPVDSLTGVMQIAAGTSHSLALTSDGTVYAWGSNFFGQIGIGSDDTTITTPQLVMSGIRTIAAGGWHSLALTPTGVAWAWGENEYGHLGDGTTIERSVPVQVNTTLRFKAIDGGDYHTIAIESVPPDTTKPTIDAIENKVLDPVDQSGAPVDFTVIATDDVTPDDQLEIECHDQDDNLFESGDVAPVGETTITCEVTDEAGNTASTSFTVTVLTPDTTIPDVDTIADRVLDPVSPSGAPVFFTVSATDDTTPADQIEIECRDQDGDLFESGDIAPIRVTTITCEVTDEAGNTASVAFTVTVRSASDLVDDLRALVNATPVDAAAKRTMLTYVAIIDGAVDGGNPQLGCLTTTILDLQIRSQESRRRIPAQQARMLYAKTAQIRSMLGCGGPA